MKFMASLNFGTNAIRDIRMCGCLNLIAFFNNELWVLISAFNIKYHNSSEEVVIYST